MAKLNFAIFPGAGRQESDGREGRKGCKDCLQGKRGSGSTARQLWGTHTHTCTIHLNVTHIEFCGFVQLNRQAGSVYWWKNYCRLISEASLCASAQTVVVFFSAKAAMHLFFFFFCAELSWWRRYHEKWKPHLRSNWAALGIGGFCTMMKEVGFWSL